MKNNILLLTDKIEKFKFLYNNYNIIENDITTIFIKDIFIIIIYFENEYKSLQILKQLKHYYIPKIFINSVKDNKNIEIEAYKNNALYIVNKPIKENYLNTLIKMALNFYKDIKEIENLPNIDDKTTLYNKAVLLTFIDLYINRAKRFDLKTPALYIKIDIKDILAKVDSLIIAEDIFLTFTDNLITIFRDIDLKFKLSKYEFIILLPTAEENSMILIKERIISLYKICNFYYNYDIIEPSDTYGSFLTRIKTQIQEVSFNG